MAIRDGRPLFHQVNDRIDKHDYGCNRKNKAREQVDDQELIGGGRGGHGIETVSCVVSLAHETENIDMIYVHQEDLVCSSISTL